MAEALEALYPGTKFGVGPAIETGFYYDVDFGDREFSWDEFRKIEDKIIEIAKIKMNVIAVNCQRTCLLFDVVNLYNDSHEIVILA